MAQNELIDFLNDETRQWDPVSISKRLEAIRLFALERWNPLKPGQKSSEIAEEIPSRISEEQMWEDIWSSTEEPVQ